LYGGVGGSAAKAAPYPDLERAAGQLSFASLDFEDPFAIVFFSPKDYVI